MWELIDKDMHDRGPLIVSTPTDTWYRDFNGMWLIDGNIFPEPMGKGSFRLITLSQAAGQSSCADIRTAILPPRSFLGANAARLYRI